MPTKKATRFLKTLSQKYHRYNGSYLNFVKSHLLTKILPPSLIVLALFLILLPFSVRNIIRNDNLIYRHWPVNSTNSLDDADDIDEGRLYAPSTAQPFVISAAIIFAFCFLLINVLINTGKLKTEHHFILTMLIFLLPLVFIYPPYEIPDEPYHFKTALRLAQYDIAKSPYENLVREPIVPVTSDCLNYSNIEVLENVTDLSTIGVCFTPSEASEPGVSIIGGNPSNVSIFVYLPAAIGIKIADFFSDSPMIIFYAGRLANFLIIYAILIFAVHNAKKHRLLLLATIFIPMFLQQSISYSYDAILNALCILIISYAIRFISTTTQVRKRDIVILAIATSFVAIIKLPYLLLCIPFLFIPSERFGTSKYAKPRAAIILFLSTTIFYLLCTSFCNIGGSAAAAPASVGRGNPISSLLNLGNAINVTLHTLKANVVFYAQSFIGDFGWFSCRLSRPLTILYYVFLIAIILSQTEKHSTRRFRIVTAITLLICSISFFIAMYLQWTMPGELVIEGVQGRYFLPLLPLLLYTCLPKIKKLHLPTTTAYSFITLSTFFYLTTILVAFY